jgi:lysophospholipase L1-like esterase
MMRSFSVLIGLLVGGVLFSQARYDSSYRFYYYDQKVSLFHAAPQRDDAVVWLGDSITDGCEWAELFPGVVALNRGISSDNTFGVLNRIGEVTRRRPAKLFILIGINDIARGIPDDVILRNYAHILDSVRLQSPRTRVIVQSLLPTNNSFRDFKNHQNKEERIASVNQRLKQLCAERGLYYLDLHGAFVDPEGKLNRQYTNDGLHLTGAGYLNWKAVLLKYKLM